MPAIQAALAAGHVDEAHALAEAAEGELIDAPDPQLYGWLHHARFKVAFLREEWERAGMLLSPRFPMIMTTNNTAWFLSAGAEVMAHLGDAEGVQARMEQAVSIRAGQSNAAAIEAATTACMLLERMKRPELNTPFLPYLIHDARDLGDTDTVILGASMLVNNVIATSDPDRMDELEELRPWLAKQDDDLARSIVDLIDHAPPLVARRKARRPRGFFSRLLDRR